jgi:hypothetical protein
MRDELKIRTIKFGFFEEKIGKKNFLQKRGLTFDLGQKTRL